MSKLQEQINAARMQVHTDSYPMSIGELVNLYDDGELDIHPEFQRVYRWTAEQKSKLIESILLGIPLPSIFVAQRKDGIWDVVDGLQRISTILSFMGKLLDEKGDLAQPLKLQGTKYLPDLKDKVWEDRHNPDAEIDSEIRRVFKREKLDIKIIKRESEGDTKFELFQRLNTGGSKLSDQEVRNCMLLMLNETAYMWLKELSKDDNFISTIPLSDKQNEECYTQELALRFFVQQDSNASLRKEHSDVAPYIDAEMTRLFNEGSTFDYDLQKKLFANTFRILNIALGEDAFKKFNHDKERYEGAISLPVYEALTVVAAEMVNQVKMSEEQMVDKIKKISKELTDHQIFNDTLEKRVRPIDRMVAMVNLGKELLR